MRGTRLSLGTRDPVVSEPGRVYLRGPARADRDEFVTMMRKSRSFHRPWATAPTDDARFDAYLTDARRPDFEAMLVCRLEDDAIVGKPYARHGYMRDGLKLVLREAFLSLRLHRVEANIQPDNKASIALAQGAGFRREGFSPRYLKIGGRWRDHERWAILADEWRARADGTRWFRSAP